jgi:dipeptidyl aminopeptidase/acylaminoacyl peptidase
MKKYRFEQYAATRLYTGAIAYSPDSATLAHVTNTTGQFNLWTVPSGGGLPYQLTAYSDNTVRAVTWHPDGKTILFTADQNGDEFHQLYLIGARGGTPEQLTSDMQAQHYIGDAFTPDGKKIAYACNARKPEQMEIVILDLATRDKLYPFPPSSEYNLIPTAWSPDGRYLLATKIISNTDQSILLYDTTTGDVIDTTPHSGETIFFPAAWSPDGSGFYFVSNSGREFQGLAFYTLADRAWKWIETPNWDVENVVISKDGRALIWSVNEDGASKLYGRDLRTGAALTLPNLPLGVVDNMDVTRDGNKLALVFAQPIEAVNLYEFDLRTGELTPLGQSMIGGIDPAEMIVPELVHYPTFDGRSIPAWLYRPRGAAGQFPVVLSIHGGPEAQERARYNYNGFYQYLLSRGFGVLAPNIRGSTGYGISYQKLIHRDWGGAELKDIEHAAKYLRSLEWVDSNRIAVFGGSFGGFATLSAVTRLPDYWALGVDIVGPANLVTFVNAVPPHWRGFMKNWVGDAEEDRDMLVERSPITYVDNLRVPLFIIQGAKDPRVVKAESDQMVERIRSNGGDVRYYVDENEGHGTTRRENTIKWYKMIVEYIEEYLTDEPVTS